ncbi:MAG: hypothetical protein R2909_16455 [Gemmatimonadales bacterium]
MTVEGFADPAPGSVAYNRALQDQARQRAPVHLVRSSLSRPARAVGYNETRQVCPSAERDMPGARSNRGSSSWWRPPSRAG